jgi:hypothetical protein
MRRSAAELLRATCRDCGQPLATNRGTYCADCYPNQRVHAAATGRAAIAARVATPEGHAERKQATSDGIAAARSRRAIAAGFDPDDWTDTILPKLAGVPLKDIASVTGTSVQNASRIRRGVRTPHPRQWAALISLADGE